MIKHTLNKDLWGEKKITRLREGYNPIGKDNS